MKKIKLPFLRKNKNFLFFARSLMKKENFFFRKKYQKFPKLEFKNFLSLSFHEI